MTKANETRKWVPPMLAGGLVMALGALPLQARPGQADPAQPASTTAPAGKLNSKDYNFLVQAARIDMDEVQLGELAQKQGASQAVRDFGQHMVNDHSKANSGLKEIAMQKGASLPAEPSQKQDATLQHLEGLSGPKFDQKVRGGHGQGPYARGDGIRASSQGLVRYRPARLGADHSSAAAGTLAHGQEYGSRRPEREVTALRTCRDGVTPQGLAHLRRAEGLWWGYDHHGRPIYWAETDIAGKPQG